MNPITDQVSYCHMVFPLVYHSMIIILKNVLE